MPLSWRFEYCGLWHLVHEGADFYFVDNRSYFLLVMAFDDERYAFFSMTDCTRPKYSCDVLRDWQAALAPVFLRESSIGPSWVPQR